jgi:BASS family bile acid:Na+ symporter
MKATENRIAIILHLIHRHFIWMIVSSYIVAAVMPELGVWIRNLNIGGVGMVGLALVASMPIAGASTAWSQNCNGSIALSLGLVLSTTMLSPLLTPFVLHMVGFVTTGDYSEDLHELASGGATSFLGIWVLLPTLLGIFAHLVVDELRVTKAMPYLKLINYLVLLLLNYSNASLTLQM